MYTLGIDVGGTNTDAVLIDDMHNVLSSVKRPTSADIYSGIVEAVDAILQHSALDPALITRAMLGTTQCTNALVERKGLSPLGVLRIGAPATLGIPPLVDWDQDIAQTCVASAIIGGGFEYDGKRLATFDEAAARSFFERIRGQVESLAIISVFSPVRNDDEQRAQAIAHEVLGADLPVSLSSEIGSMGLIERENATILNAALHGVARRFTEGFAASLEARGITCARVFISQNDGTLMSAAHAQRYPILTIACGPTNSICGASYLAKRKDAIVIDVGGTTTDLGVLAQGFPRESGVAVSIGGVRTNFRMPDVISIGLGGGSIVEVDDTGAIRVGPDSVGYDITKRARVFGGEVLTATDVAVRLGMADIGDAEKVADVSYELAQGALALMRKMVEDAIDAMKISRDPIEVVLVGGGAIVLPHDLAGTSVVFTPEHAGCANALGSAISKVSGSYEALIDYELTDREEALEKAREQAIQEAVLAGACRETVEIVDVEDIPLAYYPGRTNRVKVRAAGSLS